MALKWRDVLVLSTKHTPGMQVVSVRAPGGRIEKFKPFAIEDYNKNMVGVDKSDQLLKYYSFRRTVTWWKRTVTWWKRTVTWWKKVFFHLYNLALVNSQKLYNLWRMKKIKTR